MPTFYLPDAVDHPVRISQSFGENPAYYAQYGLDGHNGVDLAAHNSAHYLRYHGSRVLALAEGVAWVGQSDGYGTYVYITNDDVHVVYAHLADVAVRSGDTVRQGQMIGRVGYSGTTLPPDARGTHLHIGVRPVPLRLDNGMRGYVDPEEYRR